MSKLRRRICVGFALIQEGKALLLRDVTMGIVASAGCQHGSLQISMKGIQMMLRLGVRLWFTPRTLRKMPYGLGGVKKVLEGQGESRKTAV